VVESGAFADTGDVLWSGRSTRFTSWRDVAIQDDLPLEETTFLGCLFLCWVRRNLVLEAYRVVCTEHRFSEEAEGVVASPLLALLGQLVLLRGGWSRGGGGGECTVPNPIAVAARDNVERDIEIVYLMILIVASGRGELHLIRPSVVYAKGIASVDA